MTLDNYYLIAMSVAATLFSIAAVVGIVLGIWFAMRTKQLLDRIDELTIAANQMAETAKTVVETTGERILTLEKTFLTLEGLKHVGESIADAFKGRKKPTK